jgi:hypothetical protein
MMDESSVATVVTLQKAEDTHVEKIRIEQHSFAGTLWFGAWLFTLGLLHLHLWKGILAIILWPYYLGASFSSLLQH